ncbi:MAG: hydrolase, partial [Candidatus Omnitrophica bacterium]|nr:hydrolase [Candidatus Omnitrophota bacterium]
MHDILSWLDSQQSLMVDLAQRWSEINTHSTNLTGLKIFSKELTHDFRVFGEPVELIPLPNYPVINSSGEQEERATVPALAVTKRPAAPWQLLCVGHMDTVFPIDSSFQECTVIDDQTIQGPGITDMKGGLVVLFYALQALERCEWKDKVGWKVVINPDEEIGSPASSPLLRDMAGGRDLGLVFEPSLPNGDLVGDRKGSGNFTLVARGKAAHAGRNPQEGRSAIDAVAAWITQVKAFFGDHHELTINMGTISGGSAFNVIADLALVRFNVRCRDSQVRTYFEEQIPLINHRISAEHRVALKMHGTFQAPPKPL